jgi:hypothetical protein
MTIALITDQHLDGRKGSNIFWDYFHKFYDEVFFPYLEKNKIKTIIDLGDTFDNRKSIDFNVWQRIRENYFDVLQKMGVELHMIIGNHDTYYKNTNDINSPDLLLNTYSNIIVYNKPATVKFEGTNIAMIPWINSGNYEEVMNFIDETPAKIAMGHLELSGFEVTPGLKMEHGMDPKTFSKFEKVFSGHFHHKSSKGNITYLGNPYEMFWNDCDDTRGFHTFEPTAKKLKFHKNPFKIFKKIYYSDKGGEFQYNAEEYSKTYVKVIVDQKQDYLAFEKMIDNLYKAGAHDIKILETLVEDDLNEDPDLEVKDTVTLLNEYIDEVEMSVDKSNLKNLMRNLYIESLEVV